jgi:N-acetylneuraminate synthase
MFAWAKSIGIELFASAFDIESVQFLEKMGVRRHKIASCELVDLRLVKAAARTGKPLILSTGMANYDEIKAAVYAADISASNVQTTLLRCVSGYPAKPEEIGLGMIRKMSRDWMCKVGLSDHTPGTAVSVAATALGATMIEKHLTLARADGGPDAGFSMEPHEFKQLVEDCHIASEAVKDVHYGPRPTEESQLALRRSLWWAKDMEPDSKVDQYSTKTARPSTGLNPILLPSIMGKRLSRAVKMNTPVLEVDFNG